MRIAVCDDEIIIQDIIKEMCQNYLKKHMSDYEIVSCSSGEELLEYKESVDILFLDVEMKGVNGFFVAETLRKQEKDICIIFLTSHAELMQKAFRLKAFRYLLKPVSEDDFNEAIEEAVREILNVKKIIINQKNGNIFVDIKDILYIESLGDTTSICMKGKYYISNEPLKHWIEILDGNLFFQIHKSYVVGLAHVSMIEKNTVIMSDDSKLPVSIRNNKSFREKMKEYIRRYARRI